MNSSWRKAIADFWQERTRTLLVVLAIALGVSGFTAVLASYAILTRELNDDYLATNPASATLFVDRVDEATLAAVLQNPAVGAAEARRVVAGKIKSGPAEWRSLALFVVKDYRAMQVSTLQPEQGAWPPALGEVLIERDAFQVAKTRLGVSLTVKLGQGREQQLRISGRVHDVGQAQARMDGIVYGYISQETLAQLGEEPFLNQLKIVVAQDRFNPAHIRDVLAQVQQTLEARGLAVSKVDMPVPGEHPHSRIMGSLLLVMAGFGALVLLLSGVLVVNLTLALMAGQIRQIGVMKAIGGSRWQIARIYFSQALFLGLAALLLAVPAGLAAAQTLCRYLGEFLNFDIHSFAVPVWLYVLIALVGVLVPLLAAARPILKASGVSVQAALSDFGVSQQARQAFGASAIDRALLNLSRGARPLLFALRNAFRQRTRLLLTLLTLSTAGVFFMAALNVRASIMATLDSLFETQRFDLTVSLAELTPDALIGRALQASNGIKQAEYWIKTDGAILDNGKAPSIIVDANGEGAAGDFAVVALPAQTALFKPHIVAGRMLLPGETDAVVLNHVLAKKSPGSLIGSTVRLQLGSRKTGVQQADFKVVGIAREAFRPATAYIPKAFFDLKQPSLSNAVSLVLSQNDEAAIKAVKTEVDRQMASQGVQARGSYSKGEGRSVIDEHMLMIYVFLIIMAAIIGGVGGLGLMTTMSLNVLERRREMGVLRAIGASPQGVGLMVVSEAVLIGLISFVLAMAAAWPLSAAMGDLLVGLMLGSVLDFRFDPSGIWIWLLISLGLAVMASIVPAWQASRTSVREAIACQ
ncbi:ABC transporter permease [Roseateles oligotrophus]|uniref:FtsX-like permease family protein n=1 Tax=Roseateles oligotrophus TaxID=1769250 RepID=A0ABT2YGL2_9BURK|nr:FtsX-like permease family protein [Roseateles oligotrophus]MCV2369177.1 FtsX-like permease family protein [Roseateles oligotrophus]